MALNAGIALFVLLSKPMFTEVVPRSMSFVGSWSDVANVFQKIICRVKYIKIHTNQIYITISLGIWLYTRDPSPWIQPFARMEILDWFDFKALMAS